MNALELIRRKRDGGRLSDAEWCWLVDAYTKGAIPEEQMAAFLMATYLRGLDDGETLAMTLAMRDSGETLRLPGLGRPLVDKHSTGGVGDKVTLVLGPLMASLGFAMAKLSGRGLGYSGGTLDKLAAIPGFHTELTAQELADQVRRIGLAVASPTADIAPADRKIYALRDATATVEEPGLIAASIMSKKLAVAADALVLDVKVGEGAFFPDGGNARAFALRALAIGQGAGRKMSAVLSRMDRPLGREVGNAREVAEAVAVLRGEGPQDVRDVVIALAGELLRLASPGRAPGHDDRPGRALDDGSAFTSFERWVSAQGGDVSALSTFPPASAATATVEADRSGYVTAVSALAVGRASWRAGAGREKKSDAVDPAAGVELVAGEGDAVRAGDTLAVIHASSPARAGESLREAAGAFAIGDDPPEGRPVIMGYVRQGEGTDPS